MIRHENLTADLVAGVTVAIVALPLAIGFGITSGMSASAGLTTAVIAGLIAAIFGGSRFQVSGPTGAMTVVLLPIIHSYGISAIPLLGLLAGAMVILFSLFRMGRVINKTPWAVVEGFTLGIAFVIALQQIPLALGVDKAEGDRSILVAYNTVKNAAQSGFSRNALLITALTLLFKFAYPQAAKFFKIRVHIPASFIAIVASTVVVKAAHLAINSIGDIPRTIGSWAGSKIQFGEFPHLLWPAFLIAILCAIESLLSARVADGMVHAKEVERFNPDRELFGQGLATAVSSIFGGMPATGAIARTSVNVRAGAASRNSAIFHALVLLALAFIAAPLVSQIPAAAIAGVLIGTSYRILNPRSILESLRTTRSEAVVLISTAVGTLVIDLIWGIAIGIALHFIFLIRIKRAR